MGRRGAYAHSEVEQDRPYRRVQRHLSCAAVLAARHGDEAGQQVHIPPAQVHLLAPAEAGIHADDEMRVVVEGERPQDGQLRPSV